MNTQPSRLRASTRGLIALVLLLGALLPAAATAAPTVGPCAPGGSYDPACDVDHDGDVDVMDVQLSAGHWNQSGTWMSDNDHDHLGQTWTGTNNPLKIGGSFGAPDYAAMVLSNGSGSGLSVDVAASTGVYVGSAAYGFYVESATINGVTVHSASQGLLVDSAGSYGVRVDNSGADGIHICRPGNATHCSLHPTNNGVEISGTEDHGVRVDTTGGAGVYLDQIGGIGVYVDDAAEDGLHVNQAGLSGVYVGSATNGVRVFSATDWAGSFSGDVFIGGTCTGCLPAQMALNTSGETLRPGDIVAMDGIADSPFDDLDMLLRVRRATPGSALVGVVSGRAEPSTSPEDGANTLVPRNGEPAAPGEYLSVVIYGPVQVNAAGNVQLGDRVTVADGFDGVRALSTFQVQRTDGGTADMVETAPVLGVALDAAQDGLVWVLVNPQ
ncbi:MAG: hypothetical protein R2844_08335 [Caldilineales bacterium]